MAVRSLAVVARLDITARFLHHRLLNILAPLGRTPTAQVFTIHRNALDVLLAITAWRAHRLPL